MANPANRAEVITHLNGDGPKDTDGKPLVLVIMPIPFLNVVGAAPLPIRLDGDLPHLAWALAAYISLPWSTYA